MAANPMLEFGREVGIALSEKKIPDYQDPDHLTPDQVLEAAATLLDRLDDATDRFLAAHGHTDVVERQMQRDLRSLIGRIKE